MSWTLALTSQTPDTLEQAARQQYQTDREQMTWASEEEKTATDEQFEAVLAAAARLLAAGVLGDGPVRVQLSGHANPGHAAREGRASDMVSLSLSRH